MNVYELPQQLNQTRRQYRECAKSIYLADGDCALKVEEHAHVHVMEEGAFVEVQIWIPREKLPV